MLKLLESITPLARRSASISIGLALSLSVALYAAPPQDVALGLNGTRGMALDELSDRLYFVEETAGNLSYVELTPGCAPACVVQLVAAGFSDPMDVALDLDGGWAYVTTRSDIGTTGALWRVDLTAGTRSLVTFNLGAPHQIVLDLPTGSAYVTGRSLGKLWRVELATGAKVEVIGALSQPVGVAVLSDRTAAFVTEFGSGELTEIDIQLGSQVGAVASGLVSPFYLTWTDPAELTLLLAEAAPGRVLSIDRITQTATPTITALPSPPWATVLSPFTGLAYVSLGNKIVSVDLVDLNLGEPVFLGIGDVPSSQICQGYATTDPGYFRQFKHAPFGKGLNIFGNLNNFRMLGATHYRVLIQADGAPGPPTPLSLSWNAYRWDPAESRYKLTPVAPEGDSAYAIPAEYPALAYRWKPPFLMLRWPSTSVPDGLYNFSVEIGTYDSATDTFDPFAEPGDPPTDPRLPPAVLCTPGVTPPTGNGMQVMVDNTRPTIDLKQIRLHTPGTIIPACMIVEPADGCNGYDFQITASDPNRHMRGFRLRALWGYNQSATIYWDNYSPGNPINPLAPHVDEEGPYLWSGVTNLWVPLADPDGWQATQDCAHTFYLTGSKRTTDGYHHVYWGSSHQSVTINNVCWSCANACCASPCTLPCPTACP